MCMYKFYIGIKNIAYIKVRKIPLIHLADNRKRPVDTQL